MGLREWNEDQKFNLAARGLGLKADELAAYLAAHAVASIEQGDAGKRFTATRLAVLGPLGLALRKRTGHAFLTFAVDGRPISQVQLKRTAGQATVRKWIAEFNRRAS